MGRTVVHDPEDPPSGSVRFLAHDLVDQSLEGSDPGLRLAPAMDLGTSYVPGGEVGPRALTLVPMLDPHGLARGGRRRRVLEIEDSRRLLLEVRVAREKPAAMMPGPDGVLREPTPHGRFADRSDDPALHGLPLDLRHAEAREGQAMLVGQLTCEGLDRDHHVGGKSGPDGLDALALRGQRGVAQRSACATC